MRASSPVADVKQHPPHHHRVAPMSARNFADLTHAGHGAPLRWWHYTDTFAIAAFRGRTGRKIIAMAVRNGAPCCWHEPPAPLPLYGAAALQARPEAPVLVVQSEAVADAARRLFPDHVCLAWAGGCAAVDKADIKPLRGRDVVLWPDDDAGGTAMVRFQVRLQGWARTTVRIAARRAWPVPWDGGEPPALPDATAHLSPEGGGAPKGRKGDVGSDSASPREEATSLTEEVSPDNEAICPGDIDLAATSPFRRCAPPSPLRGKDWIMAGPPVDWRKSRYCRGPIRCRGSPCHC
ncbi:hypothetical protein FHP25_06040 [Vineibacter terrae]|uniref:DUF6371 domain-containing protein n=1 Tax=Vineibacter terrae TaxID=2586908 RepID=A0A5C8PSY7_9HYPH|nr:DUF6371 domain-containing protein [Vineibacter terrae]TXL79503.1 hypothetical protein FHP25_06040 [Vineibacter terrae]